MPEAQAIGDNKRGCCGCCCWTKKKKRRVDEQEQNRQVHQTTDVVFTQDLNEPLKPGSCIIIRGTVRSQCKRFAVNLLYVRGTKADIVFHFNPRLAMRYIVRNSRINNSWGDEETTSVERFYLDRNKTFELQIVASEREFLIALDGRHICAYVYRTPLDKINKIQVEGIEVEGIEIFKQIKTYPSVEGAIDVDSVNITEVDSYPTISSEAGLFTIPLRKLKECNANKAVQEQPPLLRVPITAQLPNGFEVGWQLEITGRVKILPSAFYINLQEGDALWPHPMVPLHLNPRFYTSYGNHLFVRNSWINGQWGAEERTSGFQFTPGKKFHLAIRKNPNSFGVWIDGTLAGEFQFRTPVDTIDTLYIHGDVQIYHVHLKDHVDDKYFSKSREKIDNSL